MSRGQGRDLVAVQLNIDFRDTRRRGAVVGQAHQNAVAMIAYSAISVTHSSHVDSPSKTRGLA